MVRAKFRCASVTKDEYGDELVVLRPVLGGADNAEWSKATPAGKVELTVTADGARGKFEPGRDYVLTFEPA